ncbi:MAG: FAD-dependent oxidoreductase [Parachlamydiales bacterium]|jgi:thioredoxin reductase (NADPH)
MLKKILLALFVFSLAFSEQKSQVVILGGGISGLSAGIYLGRSGLKPIILEGKEGSLITQAGSVENWPAEKKISGLELVEKLKEQAIASGCTVLKEEAAKVDFSKRPFTIEAYNVSGENRLDVLQAESCLIAMGCQSKVLNLPGEKEYRGRGVSYCALCDGPLYKDKVVAVVGGGKSALQESSYLAGLAKKVYVLIRGADFKPGVDAKQKAALLQKSNVEVLFKTQAEKILGSDKLEKIQLAGGREISVDGLFVAIGVKPNSALFQNQKLALDEAGFIETKEGQKTSLEGVFAAGDIVSGIDKQAILAAASGVRAAIALEQALSLEKQFSEQQALEKALLEKTSQDKPVLELKEEPGAAKNSLSQPLEAVEDLQAEIVEIKTKEQLEKAIKASKVPVAVDFFATWCGPCQRVSPLLEKLPSSRVKLIKINVDNAPELVKEYKIMAMPTVILFGSEGQILSTRVGLSEISSLINEFALPLSEPASKFVR